MTCERQCEANWGVHLAFYFGQPRIVQHSPSLEAGGVAFSSGGVASLPKGEWRFANESDVFAGESDVLGEKTSLLESLRHKA